jgi:hypothetical protein
LNVRGPDEGTRRKAWLNFDPMGGQGSNIWPAVPSLHSAFGNFALADQTSLIEVNDYRERTFGTATFPLPVI